MELEELLAGKVFLVDKPLDWTSFQVVNKIKYNIKDVYGIKKFKIGHAGTLDPKATGLLQICVGKATKGISELQLGKKTYTGVIKLGATTVSYDSEKPENQFYPIEHITEEAIKDAVSQFLGEISQVPPIFSAIKQEGKRLYKYARKGQEVKVRTRLVQVDRFDITQIQMPYVRFSIVCGKGTYIRSLAHDLGKALDSGAYLIALRRTKIGTFEIVDASTNALDKSLFRE